MSYYDNVKDNVKDKKTNSAGAPSFDTLKEAAEETSVDEEEKADETPIEVLEDGGLRENNSSQSQNTQQTNPQSSVSQASGSSSSVDMSSIEQKLDRMIEQNQKIIEVLESFGQ
jgi:hypothetical protein